MLQAVFAKDATFCIATDGPLGSRCNSPHQASCIPKPTIESSFTTVGPCLLDNLLAYPRSTTISSKASLGRSFMWVLFAVNRLPHRCFWWHGNNFKKRDKKWISPLGMITDSIWAMKLNVWNYIEWSYALRMNVSFHFTWCGSLENMAMNSPLRMA